jgi:hypothetical protein
MVQVAHNPNLNLESLPSSCRRSGPEPRVRRVGTHWEWGQSAGRGCHTQ